MAHGLIVESKIAAKDIDALNRSVVGSVDFDGGALLDLTAPSTVGEDRWTAAVPSTTLNGLYVAYNPTTRINVVEGREFAGLILDERAYTNIATKTFDAFKPKLGDEIEFSADAIDATVADAVAGDILESKAGQSKLTRIAASTGATANHTAFKIEYVKTYDFPQAGIGTEKVKFFRCVCIAE